MRGRVSVVLFVSGPAPFSVLSRTWTGNLIGYKNGDVIAV